MISVSGATRHADQHTHTHTKQHTQILRFFFFFWPDRVVVMAAGGLEDPVFSDVLHHRSIRIFVIPSMPAITKEQRTNGGGDARLYFPQPKLFGTIKIKIRKSKMAMRFKRLFCFFSRRRRHMSMTIKGRRSILFFFFSLELSGRG
jgi:hypothetical protein